MTAQTPATVPCTMCGVNEVDAPKSIEEDPLCLWCLRALVQRAADAAFRVMEPRLPAQRFCSTGCGVQLGNMQAEDRCCNCRATKRW